ncbi:MAG TPA: bifunctional NUDIX hydrolase family protein/GNAT family N-acetyltransferase [Candidatus Limnocylindria bacterium]|nr:bifunctional NUDIX hydrolase family protein/GNAT family N-acetyltransferase [Candidatus Limnocylindria bacterium]
MRDRPGRRGWMLGAGCEIVAPDGRLLLVEQERHGRIEWSGAGGALEDDESITDAARREALEETGLSVRLERLIAVSEFWERGHLTGVGFLFLATPDPWPQEVSLPAVDGITRFLSHRWLTREETAALEPRWRHHITRTAWPSDIEQPLFLRLDTDPAVRIRRARPSEADALTDLARRSKAYWGYSPELMSAFVPDIVISAGNITEHEVWVLENEDGRLIGLHRVVPGEPALLEDLWLEPASIGSGHGRRLWDHAVAIARSLGATAIELDADPNAEPFYARMGAVRVGETPSTRLPGRSLPRMRYELS